MTRWRILFHTPELGYGGITKVFTRLANHFAEHHDITLFAQITTSDDVRKMIDSRVVVQSGGHDIGRLRHARMMTNVWDFRRLIEQTKPHLIISGYPRENAIAGLALRTLPRSMQPKLITGEHSDPNLYLGPAGVRNALKTWMVRVALKRSDEHVAVSHYVADVAKRTFHRNDIHVLPNPVFQPQEIHELATAAPEHPWFSDSNWNLVVSIGRLTKNKGFMSLIHAIEQVNQQVPTKLIIFGDGEERDLLTEEVQRLGLEHIVSLPGVVANPYPYMKQATLFAFPTYSEGQPLVLIEALALGVPVVTTDFPGVTEYVQHEEGALIVQRGDSSALAKAIGRLLFDKKLRMRLQQNAPSLAEGYTVSVSVEAYQNLLSRVMQTDSFL